MSSAVPEGWVRIDLEEGVSALISGQSPNRKENRATGDAFGILKTTAIDWGRFDEKQNQEVLDDYEPNNKHLVLENDILITKAGPTHRVGVVAQARNLRSNVLLSGKMTALRVNDRVTPDFLTYALCQEEAQNHLKANTTGMASSQTNFTHDALLRVPILSPPLSEQKKIASILTSVDEVIENTQKQIDKLQDLKKATMNELLTKGIGHTEFKDSELGRIPVSWEVKKLNELCSPTSPITYGVLKPGNYIEGGIPLLQVKDLKDGNVDKSDIHRISTSLDQEYARSRVRFHDILISLIGTVGRVSLMPKVTETYNIHRNIGRIRLENPEWVFLHLQSQKGVQQIQLASSGSSQSALNLSALKEFLISIPPLMEQSDIISIINSLSESLTTNYRKLHQTQSLKKSLMQDLLTGKVRVTVN